MKIKPIGLFIFFMTLTIKLSSAVAEPTEKTILISSANASSPDYYFEVLKLNSKYQSLVEAHKNYFSNHPKNDLITKQFYKAQDHYLNKEFYSARSQFNSIVGQLTQNHWNQKTKTIMLQSIFYLWELSATASEKKMYVHKFLNMFPKVDSRLTDISPQFSESVEDTQEKHYKWRLPEPFRQFDIIWVNGTAYDVATSTQILLPSDTFLVTLVSNKFHPTSKVVDSTTIRNWNPSPIFLSDKSCDSHIPIKVLNFKNVKTFYKKNCIK